MKKLKVLFSVLLGFMLSLFAVSCAKTIEFDYNIEFVVGGEVFASVGTNGDVISMPKDPIKENYTFDGWYWDEGEWEEEFTLNSILDKPLKGENTFKVYAKWVADEGYNFTIVFHSNDGKDKIESQTVPMGEKAELRGNTFAYSDYYKFDSWNTKPDGTGRKFLNGEKVIDLTEQGKTVDLYAQWLCAPDVYPISSVADFQTVRDNAAKNKKFFLTNDVDFGGAQIKPIVNASGSWYGFNGLFDGNGYTIKNFKIIQPKESYVNGEGTQCEGFFGIIGNNGEVKNLGFENFTVTNKFGAVFAFESYGKIENCYADGTWNITDYGDPSLTIWAGGFVVANHGNISNCYIAGKISVNSTTGTRIGGFCYSNYQYGTGIENCAVLLSEYKVEYSGEFSHVTDELLAGIILADPYNSAEPKNCHYARSMKFEVYDCGVKADDNSSFKMMNGALSGDLSDKSFYVGTLGWDEAVWDFSEIDILNGKYPRLRKNQG